MARRILVMVAMACGCGPSPDDRPDFGADGGGPPADAAATPMADAAPAGLLDFPAEPIVEPGAPPNAPDLFDVPGADTGGPCIADPEPGTLFPRGWLRARVQFAAPAGHNLFEIRMRADAEVNDLVVYTTTPTWTMPDAMWQGLNAHLIDQPVEVIVRSARYNGTGLDAPPAASTPSSFTIAPVVAGGSLVYWTNGSTGGDVALNGFEVGDDGVHEIMRPAEAGVGCVGCHSSTPDGAFVAFSANVATEDARPAHSDLRALDGTAAQPAFLTDAARALLSRAYQHQPVFSAAHWSDGDRVALTVFETSAQTPNLIWTDLEAAAQDEGVGWGVLARTGDTGHAAAPAFSHDGALVAYVSGPFVSSGMNLDLGGGDLYTVPFNAGAGGVAAPLTGASDPTTSEHFPAFSADDRLIAFTRVPASMNSYDNPLSEVFVVPAEGGASVRLAANDPPVCATGVSPGIGNSWPKWSPEVLTSSGVRYYWLTFSSRRTPSARPQLFITAVTVDETAIRTYPALYLWNQPEDENNHTPAWDNFAIVVD